MASTFGHSSADDLGKWESNKEMDIAANSSVTDDGLLEADDQDGEKSWRDDDESEDQFEDSATATEKAED